MALRSPSLEVEPAPMGWRGQNRQALDGQGKWGLTLQWKSLSGSQNPQGLGLPCGSLLQSEPCGCSTNNDLWRAAGAQLSPRAALKRSIHPGGHRAQASAHQGHPPPTHRRDGWPWWAPFCGQPGPCPGGSCALVGFIPLPAARPPPQGRPWGVGAAMGAGLGRPKACLAGLPFQHDI